MLFASTASDPRVSSFLFCELCQIDLPNHCITAWANKMSINEEDVQEAGGRREAWMGAR